MGGGTSMVSPNDSRTSLGRKDKEFCEGTKQERPTSRTLHVSLDKAEAVIDEMTALGVCRRGNAARKKAGFGKPALRKTLTTKTRTALVPQLRLRLTNAKCRERTLKCTLQKGSASCKSKTRRNEKLAVVGTPL